MYITSGYAQFKILNHATSLTDIENHEKSTRTEQQKSRLSMKQQQIAANIRWEKHRANMCELKNLRNEVISLREENEAKSTMLFRAEQLANKYESILIKKSDEITRMKRTKRLDDLYIMKLEHSNKHKNIILAVLFTITIIGYISFLIAV